MNEFKYTIKDDLGIHARPAGLLAKAAGQYQCDIKLVLGDTVVDAKRLFKIMSLCVKCGDAVQIICDGPQEDEALVAVRAVFEEHL